MTRRRMMKGLAALPFLGVKGSARPFAGRLTDVAARAGLAAPIVYGGQAGKAYIVEALGCGIAFLDYDNDGWLDIFLLSGTRLGGAPAGTTNRLYKNNRDGTFTDVTARAGLTRTGWACGVTVADYDNDGFDDIFVTYLGANVLYRNNGDGTFTDVTARAGLAGDAGRWSTGCTFVDFDRDGRLDLFVSHYARFDWKTKEEHECRMGVNCTPLSLPKEGVTLYRNQGDGTFLDVTAKAGLGEARGYGLTTVAADFDNDGWPDLYVACDSSPSLLFRNRRDGTFREEALERGVALSEDGREQAGMGVGIGDYGLTGSLDILRTHYSGDASGLFQNDGKGNFRDATAESGIGGERRFVSWGAGFADLDNDGYPDLFVVSGDVYPERDPRIVFRNVDGRRFEEIGEEAGPGVAARHCSRGCAFGDFDNDGDVDVLIANLNEPPSLLRNDVRGGGNWIKVKLVGVKSNRSAIGARVTVRYGGKRQAQEVLAQSSYLSVSDRRLHFGLGEVREVDLEIRWPNGEVEGCAGVEANHLVTVREGMGIVERVRFGQTERPRTRK